MIGDNMENGPSDSALWVGITTGAAEPFAIVFERYRRCVFCKAYRAVHNVMDAEDIVGDVFLQAWRNRENSRLVRGSLAPWLLTIASNAILNFSRSRRRYDRLISKLPPSVDEADPTAELCERLDAEHISEALKILSPRERAVVALCILGELDTGKAAVILNVPPGTAKSRLHRAKHKLRAQLEGFGPYS